MSDNPRASQTTETDRLREALRVAVEVMEIASEWHAPPAYDIEVPPSWEDTKDPDSSEPTWPTLSGVIRKCREALGDVG
jgi:hypothetical protein